MEKSITLNETDYVQLSNMDIGPRVRYIREIIREHFGEKYSGKSVAIRIGISPSQFTFIERGKTKDIPAKVLHTICKDLNVDWQVFFDDFYDEEYKKIIINKRETDESSSDTKSMKDGVVDGLNKDIKELLKQLVNYDANPLLENDYYVYIVMYLQSENGDKKHLFNKLSKEKLSHDLIRNIVSQLIMVLDSTDVLVNPEHVIYNSSPIEQAEKHLQLRSEDQWNLWYPSSIYKKSMSRLEEVGEEYTNLLRSKMPKTELSD